MDTIEEKYNRNKDKSNFVKILIGIVIVIIIVALFNI